MFGNYILRDQVVEGTRVNYDAKRDILTSGVYANIMEQVVIDADLRTSLRTSHNIHKFGLLVKYAQSQRGRRFVH